MSQTDIKQLLKTDEFRGIRNANLPSALNPFATLADLSGGAGILSPVQWYILQENFDRGVLPQGWIQTSSGPPATVSYSQIYETGAIGHVLLSAPGPAALFASVTFANGYNYLLNFSDCEFTQWNANVRRNATNVGVALVGLANVAGSAVPSVFGNVIALVHDPNNMTGANGGLVTNWFVWVKDASGQTLYDTGVAPNDTWQFVDFKYDSTGVVVQINGVTVVTVPNTDPNLFVSQVSGATAGLKPV
jgi:hypothetical protein